MKEHDLKTWPGPFQAVWDGVKRYEIRKDDRCFAVGDVLVLREWDPFTHEYTRRHVRVIVSYMTPGGEWSLPVGVCVMGLGEMMTKQDAIGCTHPNMVTSIENDFGHLK